jgi:uncharacterized protein YeaO (DUF488 family)
MTVPIAFDTTVKSGNKAFAPTWDMVMNSKSGLLSPSGYTIKFNELMRRSQESHPEIWAELLDQEEVVLVCFCAHGKFCHRHLLAKILADHGATYMGELDPKTHQLIKN